jgi:hypothetical protein
MVGNTSPVLAFDLIFCAFDLLPRMGPLPAKDRLCSPCLRNELSSFSQASTDVTLWHKFARRLHRYGHRSLAIAG